MSHIPVNHHLRPSTGCSPRSPGSTCLVFGALGFVETSGGAAFDQGNVTVLGLRTNLAFSIASVVAGAVILLALFVGRNVDYLVNLCGGIAFLVRRHGDAGAAADRPNVLNFSMATCIVSFVIGMVLFSAGLYGKIGSVARPVEEALRHGGH